MQKSSAKLSLLRGGRDDISVQILLEDSRIFCRQKLADSDIEIKRRFRKHDLNFMNSVVIVSEGFLTYSCK